MSVICRVGQQAGGPGKSRLALQPEAEGSLLAESLFYIGNLGFSS